LTHTLLRFVFIPALGLILSGCVQSSHVAAPQISHSAVELPSVMSPAANKTQASQIIEGASSNESVGAGNAVPVEDLDMPALSPPAPRQADVLQTAVYQPLAVPVIKPYVPSFAERKPERFLRLNRSDLSNILGAPVVIRQEHVARIWQYRSRSCVVDLFLYPKAGDEAHEVIHIEARAWPRGVSISAAYCLAELLVDRRLQQADSRN
jgi:hypothetical protein